MKKSAPLAVVVAMKTTTDVMAMVIILRNTAPLKRKSKQLKHDKSI